MISAVPEPTMVDMDAELEKYLHLLPIEDLTDPVKVRRELAERVAARPPADTTGLEIEDVVVPGEPDVPVRVYRPADARGVFLWFHGGGFTTGSVESDHPWVAMLARAAGTAIVSVDYRLSPENRYPAALDDAFTVLRWAAGWSDAIGVAGHSAGANLAAGLALRARDEGGPRIAFQLLNQPALDDRLETWSARAFTDTPGLTRAKITDAWRNLLGGAPADVYCAPARAADLSGLPPAHIATAEFCPARDEGLLYGLRLLQAGVSVELHQWPGTFHSSQAIVSADVSRRQLAELGAVMRRAL